MPRLPDAALAASPKGYAGMNAFAEQAAIWAGQGWASHPLRMNEDGFAKVAITRDWQHIQPEDSLRLDWSSAKGIGLIGGSNSCNLGFIDIDDQELSARSWAWLIRSHKNPLCVYTARQRLHVYVIEPKPSAYKSLDLRLEGRRIKVELRAQGSYVAAPPTQKYQWANPEWEPIYGCLIDVWNELKQGVGEIDWWPHDTAIASSGYPPVWQNSVAVGERNQAFFKEACQLKDAGIFHDEAWRLLQIRVQESYSPPIPWRELQRTFESAYRRPLRDKGSVGVSHGIGIE